MYAFSKTQKGQDLFEIIKLIQKINKLKSIKSRGQYSMGLLTLTKKFQKKYNQCPFELIDDVFGE